MLFVVCGASLILFNNWINKATITIGFEAINRALSPVYIGIVLAFLMCPLYNYLVGRIYHGLQRMDGHSMPAMNSFHSYRAAEVASLPASVKNRKNLSTSRIISSFICLVTVIGFVALMIYFVAPQLITTSKALVDTAPDRLDYITEYVARRFSKYPTLAEKIETAANMGFKEVMDWIKLQLTSDKAQDFAAVISTGVVSVIGALLNTFVGVLVMVYLLNYKEKLFAIVRKFSAAVFKEKTQDNLKELVAIIDTTFVDFIVGRILDSTIIGILTFICMTVFGMPYAPMISVIIGVTNVIPFFGPFIGAVPSVIILLIEHPTDAFWFILMILLIQQLDGNVIGPKIVGSAIGIESFWVLVAVLVGGKLFGFMGMVLGVPVFAVIYKYINKLVRKKLYGEKKHYKTTDYMTFEEFGIDISEVELGKVQKKSLIRRKSRKRKLPSSDIPEEAEESSENMAAKEMKEVDTDADKQEYK